MNLKSAFFSYNMEIRRDDSKVNNRCDYAAHNYFTMKVSGPLCYCYLLIKKVMKKIEMIQPINKMHALISLIIFKNYLRFCVTDGKIVEASCQFG